MLLVRFSCWGEGPQGEPIATAEVGETMNEFERMSRKDLLQAWRCSPRTGQLTMAAGFSQPSGLPAGGSLEALKKALELRIYSLVNRQH